MPSEITLSLLVGTATPTPAPREVMEALTQVEVSSSARETSGFDLTFAVSKRSAIATRLLPSGYFDPATRVVITATVKGQATVLMDGVITHQELVPSDESGRSVLSIKGEDLTRMMDLIDSSGLPFPAMPAEAQVAQMLAKYVPKYKITPQIMSSVIIDVPNPLEEIRGQRGTDLTYIKMLADNVGYVFYLQPGPRPGMSVAYWGPMLQAAIPFLPTPTPIAIDWDGRSNVESLQFSFDGFAKSQWKVVTQQSTIPIPAPDVNPPSAPLGKKTPPPLKISPMVGLAKYKPNRAAAIALAQAAMTANVVSGQGTLDVLQYGSVLPARTIVEIRGAGITYDGQYFVDATTHTIKPGSYKQQFTLTRNALIVKSGVPGVDALSYQSSPGQSLAGFPSTASAAATDQPGGLPFPPGPVLPMTGTGAAGAGRDVPLPASP